MTFYDDEPIPVQADSGKPKIPERGRVTATVIKRNEAILKETNFKSLVKLTGAKSYSDRQGVDIVAVLDVSGSMGDDQKLEKLKSAMQFMIRKLGFIDRLSLVSFSSGANRLCPLSLITNQSQSKIEEHVHNLKAEGGTNISAGLGMALQVLKERKYGDGRVGAIMLMSDGQQNEGDAASVAVDTWPVFTFGFGTQYDAKVLNAIASKSNNGTFSFADVDKLSVAFSQCLGGLLTVVVQELDVTIKPLKVKYGDKMIEPKIQNLHAGNYERTVHEDGAITIHFGNLYAQETRKIVLEMILPEVDRRISTKIFEVTHTYNYSGNSANKLVTGSPKTVNVIRTGTTSEQDQEPEELATEAARVETTGMMKDARILADAKKYEDATYKLVDAENKLEDVKVEEEPNIQAMESLKTEVGTFKDYMETPETYETLGRPFALASETSHERQRFASRGDDDSIRMFATPRMDVYLEQAKAFDENPKDPIPSADEDAEKEIKEDPLGPFMGIAYYIQTAIECLQAVQEILTNATSPK